MAQNPPPVTRQQEEQIVIVRGSEEHKDYLKHQFGHIKEMVNSFETRIAVAGRALLLIYVVYITVKAATANSLPHNVVWLSLGLVVLDIIMQALQVLGLEGSVPGLIHLAEELEARGKAKEAGTIRFASNMAQWLLAFTAIDIVLESNHTWGGMDISGFAAGYTNCLFIIRVIVIGLYLVAMARLEHKGPKIVSVHEAARREQEQIRMDNTAIQNSISQALNSWTQNQATQQQARNDEALEGWMKQQSQQFAEQFASLKQSTQVPEIDVDALTASIFASLRGQFDHQIEAAKQQSEAEIRRQIEAAKRDIEAKMSVQPEAPRRKADTPTSPRHEAASKPAIPGLLQLPTDRLEKKAKALEMVDSGLSTYKVAELTTIPAGTIQRWLSERAKEQERKATLHNQGGNEARDA